MNVLLTIVTLVVMIMSATLTYELYFRQPAKARALTTEMLKQIESYLKKSMYIYIELSGTRVKYNKHRDDLEQFMTSIDVWSLRFRTVLNNYNHTDSLALGRKQYDVFKEELNQLDSVLKEAIAFLEKIRGQETLAHTSPSFRERVSS